MSMIPFATAGVERVVNVYRNTNVENASSAICVLAFSPLNSSPGRKCIFRAFSGSRSNWCYFQISVEIWSVLVWFFCVTFPFLCQILMSFPEHQFY